MTDHEDHVEAEDRVTQSLSLYIKDHQKLKECAEKIIAEIGDQEEDEEHNVYDNEEKPLERDEFLPWQDSVMQPANAFSLATKISTAGVNRPDVPAYSPAGTSQPVQEGEEESDDRK